MKKIGIRHWPCILTRHSVERTGMRQINKGAFVIAAMLVSVVMLFCVVDHARAQANVASPMVVGVKYIAAPATIGYASYSGVSATSGLVSSYSGSTFYVLANTTGSGSYTLIDTNRNTYTVSTTAVAPTFSVSSLGCPTTATQGVAFTCSPTVSSNISSNPGTGSMVLTWSGTGISASGNTLTINSYGTFTATLTYSHSQASGNFGSCGNSGSTCASLSQTITVAPPYHVTVSSLGCPTTAKAGVTFTCTPTVDTNVSSPVYTWSGSGIIANGNNLTTTSTGSKTITLTVSGNSITGSGTQTLSVSNPNVVSVSTGCPTTAQAGVPFSCSPSATSEAGSSITYAWSGSGISASGNVLTAESTGSKTITVTATDSVYSSSAQASSTVDVTTPEVIISSLGCPSTAKAGVTFTCSPVTSSAAPGTIALTWSGDGVSANGNTLTVTKTGAVAVQLTATNTVYGGSVQAQQTVTLSAPTVTISSVGCPTTAKAGVSFTCTPAASSEASGSISYAWSGTGVTAAGNILTITTVGSKTITLTATDSTYGGSAQAQQTITATIPSITITTVGCPTSARAGVPVTCTPTATPEASGTITYAWSGTGVSTSGNALTFTTVGSVNVTLTASQAIYGGSTQTQQTVTVTAPNIAITSFGCPSTIKAGVPVTCTPQTTTEASGSLTYAWAGEGLTASGNVLTFSKTGEIAVTLTATQSLYGGSGVKNQTLTVSAPAVTITSAGCPTTAVAGIPFMCTPSASSQTGSTVTYSWAGSNLSASGNSLTITSPGTATITLTATDTVYGTTAQVQPTITVTPPAMTISSLGCPSNAITGLPVTCTPSATSAVAGVITYTWSGTGVSANGNTLTFSQAGTVQVTLTASQTAYGASTQSQQGITVIAPSVTVSSLGCPGNILTGKPVACTPTVSTNLPDEFLGGVTYTWSGDGVSASGNTLTLASEGAKTLTLSVHYPLANYTGSGIQNVIVITPSVTVSSLGCPVNALFGKPINCSPTVTTNLPDEFTIGVAYTWSGNSLSASGNDITFTGEGSKVANLTVTYPLAEASGTNSQSISVIVPSVTISSAGCPTNAVKGVPLACSPVVTTNLPEEYRGNVTYSWSGNGVSASGNTLTMASAGTTTVNLSVNYPLAEASGTTTQDVTVIDAQISVTSLGCPSDVLLATFFACTPVVSTNLPEEYRAGMTYSWTSDGLQGVTEQLAYQTEGTKTIALTVNYPLAGASATGTQQVNVINPSLVITSLGCASDPVALTAFTCNPIISSNIPTSMREGAVYTWAGESMTSSGNTLTINSAGTKAVTLTVNYPLANTLNMRTESITVKAPTSSISSLGCPTYTMIGKATTCSPTIESDLPVSYKEGAVYTWSGDGVSTNEDGTLKFSNPGGKTVTLKVTYPLYKDLAPSNTQTVVVVEPYVTISDVGCPATNLTTRSFTCSPQISTNIPESFRDGVTYTWSGSGLVVEEGGTLRFAEAGANNITLVVRYPLTETEGTKTQVIDVIQPKVEIQSISCPENAIVGKSFKCTPVYTSNIPSAFLTGVLVEWSGDGLEINGESLTYATGGAKTTTLKVTYPLADTSATLNQVVNVIEPSVQITSLGCPKEIVTAESFQCSPVITTNLPSEFLTGETKEWTASGLKTAENGSLVFETAGGNKEVTLIVQYPLAGVKVQTTETITVGSFSLSITSLGCPTSVMSQELFSCTPVVDSDLPESYRSRIKLAWSGASLVNDADGMLSLSGIGDKSVTLGASISGTEVTAQLTGMVNVQANDLQITSLGCPDKIISSIPFKCTPVVDPTPGSTFQYAWSGDTLNVLEENKMVYQSAGKSKSLILTATDSLSGKKYRYGNSIEVETPVIKISTLECPATVRQHRKFTCTTTLDTNLPTEVVNTLAYQWVSEDFEIISSGNFRFTAAGNKGIALNISHPEYEQVYATASVNVGVTEAFVNVRNLGCPTYITEYAPFTCTPSLNSDRLTDITTDVTYNWKVGGEAVSSERVLSAITKESGETEILLTATVIDPDTGDALMSSSKSVTVTIRQNTSKLKLRVTTPKRVITGTSATVSAATSFTEPTAITYNWTINGQAYDGESVTFDVPDGQTSAIEFSVTAKAPELPSITPETISGKINVVTYTFPRVSFSGPRARVTNIVPFKSIFRLYIRNPLQTPLTYVWDFGDGTVLPATTEMQRSVTHVYEQAATYKASVTISDDRGNTNRYECEVLATIAPPRTAVIKAISSSRTNRVPLEVYFRYALQDGISQDVAISNTWSVNGQVLSDKAITTLSFTEPGTYNVKLDVTTKYGNTIVAETQILVNANNPPMCDVSSKMIKKGKYQLDAMCYDSDGRIVSYLWDLGNDRTATSARVYMEYESSGAYTARVTGTDDSGGTATAEVTINVD